MADFRALAGRLRRYPDPESSTDPVVSALIGHLRALPAGPSMRADFRAELRAQLVAATPRLVAEGVAADDSPATTDRLRAAWQSLRAGASRIPMRRPLAVVGSLVVIFGLLLAGAVWMSSRTLPGDSLYGLKRASENVQLSLISGDGARGREYLSLAKKRASEVYKPAVEGDRRPPPASARKHPAESTSMRPAWSPTRSMPRTPTCVTELACSPARRCTTPPTARSKL